MMDGDDFDGRIEVVSNQERTAMIQSLGDCCLGNYRQM